MRYLPSTITMWRTSLGTIALGVALQAAPAVAAVVLMSVLLTTTLAFAQADWTLRHPSVSPSARASASMAEFGSSVILFGGENLNGTAGDTWIWDGTNWTQITSFGLFGTGPQPPARSHAVMAYHPPTGEVVLFGGTDANGNSLSDTWIFVLASNALLHRSFYEWIQVSTSPAPPARQDATMEYDPKSNRMILTSGLSRTVGYLQDTWAFNPATSSWTPISATGPTPSRLGAAMAKCAISANPVPDRILLFGGTEPVRPIFLNDTWIYLDTPIISLTWGQVTPATAPFARYYSAMAYYPVSNQDVLFGGANESQFSFFDDTWTAFCGTWTQATPAHNPGARRSMAMATGAGGFNVVLFGGSKTLNLQAAAYSNETWTWGKRVACLPRDGSELPVGSAVTCQFDLADGIHFEGWLAYDFAPPLRHEPTTSFHTEAPGSAFITAFWRDATGWHSETFTYTIVRPHR